MLPARLSSATSPPRGEHPTSAAQRSAQFIARAISRAMDIRYQPEAAEAKTQLKLQDWEARNVHLRPLRKGPRAVWEMPC